MGHTRQYALDEAHRIFLLTELRQNICINPSQAMMHQQMHTYYEALNTTTQTSTNRMCALEVVTGAGKTSFLPSLAISAWQSTKRRVVTIIPDALFNTQAPLLALQLLKFPKKLCCFVMKQCYKMPRYQIL